MYASEQKSDWIKYLGTAQMAINGSFNEDLGMTPSEALYGKKARQVEIGQQGNQMVQVFAHKIRDIWSGIGTRIDSARAKVKTRLDKTKRPVTIEEGQKAYVNTKNMTDEKLDQPFVGPYLVKSVRGTTVELDLPGTKTFPKFHASLIKKAPDKARLKTDWLFSKKEEYEVERIVDKRQNDNNETEFFVKWKNYDWSELIWEPRANLDHAQKALKEY